MGWVGRGGGPEVCCGCRPQLDGGAGCGAGGCGEGTGGPKVCCGSRPLPASWFPRHPGALHSPPPCRRHSDPCEPPPRRHHRARWVHPAKTWIGRAGHVRWYMVGWWGGTAWWEGMGWHGMAWWDGMARRHGGMARQEGVVRHGGTAWRDVVVWRGGTARQGSAALTVWVDGMADGAVG